MSHNVDYIYTPLIYLHNYLCVCVYIYNKNIYYTYIYIRIMRKEEAPHRMAHVAWYNSR